jgi:hypothetical protein
VWGATHRRRKAAKSDTSINALFNAELRYLVETFESAELGGNQNYKALLDFSLGRAREGIFPTALSCRIVVLIAPEYPAFRYWA